MIIFYEYYFFLAIEENVSGHGKPYYGEISIKYLLKKK